MHACNREQSRPGVVDDVDDQWSASRHGLRYAIGGPLGMVLTLAAGASMIAYFIRNQKDILAKVSKYKVTIAEVEKKYAEAQSGWRDGKLGVADRNLMIDGLMKRFIADIDAT